MEKKEIILRFSGFFKNLGKVLLFVIAICFGYGVCELYHFTIKEPEVAKQPQTIKQTSVAINERGELMLINRKTGDYTIYQDSVGESIFNLYASQIKNKYEK